MASTAGARHFASSKIWLAFQEQSVEHHAPNTAPLIETAIQHVSDEEMPAFLQWLEDALEGEDNESKR